MYEWHIVTIVERTSTDMCTHSTSHSSGARTKSVAILLGKKHDINTRHSSLNNPLRIEHQWSAYRSFAESDGQQGHDLIVGTVIAIAKN